MTITTTAPRTQSPQAAAKPPAHRLALRLALRAAERAMRPKVSLTVSEWAGANRILSEDGSPEPGPWKNARNPHLVEIMDCLSEDAPHHLVVYQKPSQFGGTEVASNFLGYIMTHAKGPVAVVMPTDKAMADWMSQKFDPMAKTTPAVASVLRSRSNKSGDNSAHRKKFTGGILYAKTAGSTADLKSTSLRYAIADECDEYDWTTNQGDPLGLLQVRLTAFHDHKLFAVSSPTLTDASQIADLYLAGDRRQRHVPCPHCDEYQTLKWANLRWTSNPTHPTHIARAWYVCEHCGSEIDEHHKTAMFARGRWIPEAPGAPYPSFQNSALYSPIGLGRSWVQLAIEWIEAQGDHRKLMRFINTRLAETYANRSRDIKPNTLQARAEPYPLRTIPVGCLALTAGVDTQDDRLEIHIVGHGRADRTWTIDYHILPGNPADESLWDTLTDYLARPIINAFCREMRVEATAIDSGGHHTHAVYQYVRRRRLRHVMAIKGASTAGRLILGRPVAQDVTWRGVTTKKGVMLYLVGTDTAKHLLYTRLLADADKSPKDRKVHFSDELPTDYYEQLVAETFNPTKNQWVKKKSKRNETLDTWVYAIAASHHPELHLHKWKAGDWTRRALMVEPPNVEPGDPAADIAAAEPSPASSPPEPAATQAPAAARKRRVIQRPPAFPTR